RSTTFSQALSDRSLTKASISAGVGGRPVRSKVARRISVRRSAGGAGVNRFASSFARMKRSIGILHQAAFFTFGSAGRFTGWNDQCFVAVRGAGSPTTDALRAPVVGTRACDASGLL